MAPSTPQISLAEVKALPLELIHAGKSAAQADLYRLDWQGTAAVLKDFSARPLLLRLLWSRPVLAREHRALRRLWGVEGIPRLIGEAGPDALLMEWVPGKKITKKGQHPPLSFFDRSADLIRELHIRGIGHGDVRRTNLLLGPEGEPYLIDFATAVRSKPGVWGLPARLLFALYERLDFFQLAQIKREFHPNDLTPEESALLNDPPWYLKFGKGFRRYVYRYRKGNARRKLMKRLFGSGKSDSPDSKENRPGDGR